MSARDFLQPSVLARGFFVLEVAAREFSKPAVSARVFLLPSVLARDFFPLAVAAREFSLPAVLARFFFLQTVCALGGFLVSLRAGGLASPGSHLGAKAGVSCASLRSELWCFFFVSAFSHSLRILKCCSTFLFYEAREILVFSHRVGCFVICLGMLFGVRRCLSLWVSLVSRSRAVSLLASRVSWLLSVCGSVQHFLVSVLVQLHM